MRPIVYTVGMNITPRVPNNYSYRVIFINYPKNKIKNLHAY